MYNRLLYRLHNIIFNQRQKPYIVPFDFAIFHILNRRILCSNVRELYNYSARILDNGIVIYMYTLVRLDAKSFVCV